MCVALVIVRPSLWNIVLCEVRCIQELTLYKHFDLLCFELTNMACWPIG